MALTGGSLDHLFIDQDAIPTLVEVKRSSDTRIRREAVGQMFDYAANAVVYWPINEIIKRFEKTCEKQGVDPSETIDAFLNPRRMADESEGESPEAFWESVETNLQAGKIRLVFLADKIPTELQRIVEFLNDQMERAEVLAVELRQYVGEGVKTLVPRVVGQTASAKRKKALNKQSNQPIHIEWQDDSASWPVESWIDLVVKVTSKALDMGLDNNNLPMPWAGSVDDERLKNSHPRMVKEGLYISSKVNLIVARKWCSEMMKSLNKPQGFLTIVLSDGSNIKIPE